ncbi:Concanavalin A-like lectin/glucanase [Purpureocillium lilacinum]|uniref:Concanavalin A-like lectin/glucanase n=1 Tax=Purpureocillium lilacinum TaxID=33203 RepID=A0A179HK19_PURLI|nr:Concanavalin A-like lectin/glucanase [Purpureocillium lilacinum]OAQ67366.1 Concanavalin A-like lectin/glucanase [Purpureocillium lilacinum]OAQ89819.1 Concanavalin A-like lectin/glucanase [Purpureocillium lilacinum]PWI68307.1 hypothetical protein PCL_02076 [Purpureocillium lilacinum]
MRLSVALLGAAVPRLVTALCECGYSAKGPDSNDAPWLFTDALESDFTNIADIATYKEWTRQKFDVTPEAGRGKYAKSFAVENVVSRPKAGGGLDLAVGSALKDDAVPAAEIDSANHDMHWGSYRAGMKLTAVNGTCGAFFWYFNDTQEIDMEFLSREFDPVNKVYPVNLVIQSPASKLAGYDASKTGLFKTVNLTFDPTADFHEYRFDYLPGRVIFYADSKRIAEMQGPEMPSDAGHLVLQHWSNGNPLWSGGPPMQDAIVTVSYVKAYFNSTASLDPWTKKCADKNVTVCAIPDGTATNASTGGPFLTDSKGRESGGPGMSDVQVMGLVIAVGSVTLLALL